MDANSNLNIDDIKIIESEFKLNFDVPLSEWKDETPVSLSPEFLIGEDSRHGRVKIEAELFSEDYLEKDYPYYLRVVVLGQFSLLSDDANKDVFDEYAVSMTSLLLPYVRSYIAALTGLSGMSGVNIPAINVLRLFEELADNQK